MTTIFAGYVTKDNAEELAKVMHCLASTRNESVLFGNVNEYVFDVHFSDIWGSSQTLGSKITEYYHVPYGTVLVLKQKSYTTTSIFSCLENSRNVDIVFESLDGKYIAVICADGTHDIPNLSDCINVKWIIKKFNDISV